MIAYLEMGEFSYFIWSRYLVSFFILGWLGYSSWRKVKITIEQLKNLEAAIEPATPKKK